MTDVYKKIILSFLLPWFIPCLTGSHVQAQHILSAHSLPPIVHETSGSIYFNERLITFNDSNGDNKLYELDPNDGSLLKEIVLNGAQNTDWEDICQDEAFIFVADIGNNAGSRKDLTIYFIPKADYLNAFESVQVADSITFRYKDQTNFEESWLATRHDAEALISAGDYLYLFTKNWLYRWTAVYRIAKIPGDYEIEKIDSIPVPGVITGGVNIGSSQIALTGYNIDSVFVTRISNFPDNKFSLGTIDHMVLRLPEGTSPQVEAICTTDGDTFFLTSERNDSLKETLFEIKLDEVVKIKTAENNRPFVIHNNSSKLLIRNDFENESQMNIYNSAGRLCKISSEKYTSISDMKAGLYFIVLNNKAWQSSRTQKLLVLE